jgi:hypothetical protein
MHSYRAITARAALIVSGLFGLGQNAYPQQGKLICNAPTVQVETQSCGGGKILTQARVTNTCACEAYVAVRLQDGGSAIFPNVKGNGTSEPQMIKTCDSQQGNYKEIEYHFTCPSDRQTGVTPSNQVNHPNQAPSQEKTELQKALEAAQKKTVDDNAKKAQEAINLRKHEAEERARARLEAEERARLEVEEQARHEAEEQRKAALAQETVEREGSGFLYCFGNNYARCMEKCEMDSRVTRCTGGCRGNMIRNGRFCYYTSR